MINDFDDFCLWMYVIVDDIWQQIAPFFKRPGPAPQCSDSELLTMALIGECRGWDVETEMLSHWQEHRDLFPCIPSQSRFNRRRRHLMAAFNLVRRVVLEWLDLAQDQQCLMDSLPIPVVQFYLVPSSTGDWKAYGARFGKVASKKQTIFGYKLHLYPGNNVAKNVIDFSIAIPRERLRPNYGDGFRGAPLDASHSSQDRIDQNRGVNRDEPKTAKGEVDRAAGI